MKKNIIEQDSGIPKTEENSGKAVNNRLYAFIKAAVIVFAALTVTGRFITYKYFEAMPQQTRTTINVISLVCGAVLAVFAVAWIIIERKNAKASPPEKNSDE